MEHSKHTVWPYPPEIKPARQFTWREAASSMLIVSCLAAILWPVCTVCGRGNPRTCISNVKMNNTALLMYAQDYDDRLPASNWMDSSYPYVKYWLNYACPKILESNPNEFGLAFESNLLGVSTNSVKTPSHRILVYDSSMLYKNATESFQMGIARPGRHNNKNTIGFMDGHVTHLSVPQSISQYH